jgi:hypothetical protein
MDDTEIHGTIDELVAEEHSAGECSRPTAA